MVASRSASATSRAPSIGVALSASRFVTVWSTANGSFESRDLPIEMAGTDGWAALRDALRETVSGWRSSWGDAACSVHVALLASLAEVRTVTLPPVSASDAQRLLARAAARHFLTASEPVAVSVADPITTEAGTTTRVAAATPTRLLRALRESSTAVGVALGDVVPALAIWSLGDAVRRAPHGVLEVGDTRCELVTWRNGAPIAVRRFARPDDLPALCDACVAQGGSITVVATHTDEAAIARALAPHGVTVVRAHPEAPVAVTEDAAARAAWRLATASWSTTDDSPPLAFSDHARETPRREAHASAAWRRRALLATGLLLSAAAGVYRVGVLRELEAVRHERALFAPLLDSLGLRTRSNDPLAVERTMHEVARSAVPWSHVLATLGVAMPRDAQVLSVRAVGDTIELDGTARDAGGVFTALEQARFTDLTATAPVRRERRVTGEVTERFTFRARVPLSPRRTASPRIAEGTP